MTNLFPYLNVSVDETPDLQPNRFGSPIVTGQAPMSVMAAPFDWDYLGRHYAMESLAGAVRDRVSE